MDRNDAQRRRDAIAMRHTAGIGLNALFGSSSQVPTGEKPY